MGRITSRLFVAGTTALISFIGFSSQIFLILPGYTKWNDPELAKMLLPFNALLALVFYNYYLCVTVKPGKVPKGWIPDLKNTEKHGVEVKRLSGAPRYCKYCRVYKPPRSHHCKSCKTCVLKMDHHCPWINNCVGHKNHGHFIRFLFFVDLACMYHIWMVTMHSFRTDSYFVIPSTSQIVMLILNYTTCVPVLLAVGIFSIYHFWCIATNTTTIEGWEKDKMATLKRRGRIQEFRYPYNLGVIKNVKSVLGSSILLWCVPQRAEGTGLEYEVSSDLDPIVQYAWPPKDEFSTNEKKLEREAQERIRAAGEPFTYGDGLNPSLTRRRVRERAPYLDEQLSDDDDDIPLGRLAANLKENNIGDDNAYGLHIRHGSEGMEVKPGAFSHTLQTWDGFEPPIRDDEEDTRGVVGSEEWMSRYNVYKKDGNSSSSDDDSL